MTNVIDLLEKMGRDAHLRHASKTVVAELLKDAQVPGGLQDAILSNSHREIEQLLGASANVCCVLGAVEEGEDGCGSTVVRQS